MVFEQINTRRYARFERLARAEGLRHAFSTRGWNVSARRDGHAAARGMRRALMAQDLGLEAARLCHCEQVHGTEIAVIDAPRAGGPLAGTDAVVTNVPGQPVMTFSADCPLVLVFDPVRRVVGLVHASWRCTVALLTQRAVRAMQERWGCDPGGLLAGIGPSAGPQRYEVGSDVYEAAAGLPKREALFARVDGRICFDLWLANRVQLEAAGVPGEAIETAGICTLTRTELFYSYRREGPGCGHFGLLAGLV